MIKHYLITDPSFYTSNPAEVVQKLLHVKANYQPDYICLRDKITSDYASSGCEG